MIIDSKPATGFFLSSPPLFIARWNFLNTFFFLFYFLKQKCIYTVYSCFCFLNVFVYLFFVQLQCNNNNNGWGKLCESFSTFQQPSRRNSFKHRWNALKKSCKTNENKENLKDKKVTLHFPAVQIRMNNIS